MIIRIRGRERQVDKRPPTAIYECFECDRRFADYKHVTPPCPKCGEMDAVYEIS